MREIAAERRLLADAHRRHRRERCREPGRECAHLGGPRQRTVGGERSQRQPSTRRSDGAKLLEPPQADHASGPDELLLHQDHQRRATGHDEGVLGILRKQRDGLVKRLGFEVVERPHRPDAVPRARAIARAMP